MQRTGNCWPGREASCSAHLHTQILEEAHLLPELLTGLASSPEADAPRTVQGRLQRMLALRSLLELAAAWEDAPQVGQPAPGWTSGSGRQICVLPWHTGQVKVAEGWHLHHLRRWHQPHPGTVPWENVTTAWITRAALLQDVGVIQAHSGPLPADLAERQRRRGAGSNSPGSTSIDLDPDAFVRRARLALSAVLEPALCGFGADEVLQAVQGARSGTAALSRLLPGVSAGPVQALGEQLRRDRGYAERPWAGERSEGRHAAAVSGPCAVRRSTWTVAQAGHVPPHECLATEAAAGPLHLLTPGLQHAGPASAVLKEGWLSTALEEVRDLFTAVSALPADQELPLPDLSGLLTGRGFLRLGAHAPTPAVTPTPDDTASEHDWQRERALALRCVSGLTEAAEALRMMNAYREQIRAQIRREVCLQTGLSEAELAEATGGERAFERMPEDPALERELHWTGGVWALQLARHPQDLVLDGRALSHCVGWGGYAQTVRTGRARIVRALARGPDDEIPFPLLTLELGVTRAVDDEALLSWKLLQARGANNRAPTRDEATLIGLWAREVGIHLDTEGEVAPLTALAARLGAVRLGVQWKAIPAPRVQAAPLTSEAAQQAVRLSADRTAARWTPAATRTHQEGLRRVASLIERARTHLTGELRRLHDAGDALLVGSLASDELLSGTGELVLAPDSRPLLQALTLDGSPQVAGLRIERRTHLSVDHLLRAREQRQTLDLRPGRKPGELALHFCATGRTQVNSFFSPVALMNTGLLDPLHVDDGQNAWTWGVARRRVAGLTLLWSVLDESLGELERAARMATGHPGSTLREQLSAWTKTATAPNSRK